MFLLSGRAIHVITTAIRENQQKTAGQRDCEKSGHRGDCREEEECTLTRMYIRVFLHVALLVEALATVLAGIRSCVGVDQQVSRQGGGAFERLAALFALKGLLRRVHGSMLTQADLVTKSLVAQLAGKRSPAGVRSTSVHFEPMRGGEDLVTLDTRKDQPIRPTSCQSATRQPGDRRPHVLSRQTGVRGKPGESRTREQVPRHETSSL